MKQVDTEIMVILKGHEKEKNNMQAEIDDLRAQVNKLNKNSAIIRNPSIRSFSQYKGSSSVRESSNHSTSRDTVEECLSKFTGVQLRKDNPQQNVDSENMVSLSRQSSLKKSTTLNSQKENMFLPNISITEEE